MKKYIILAVVFICCVFSVNAQDNQPISGEFSASSFNQLVSKIEAQTRYHFFYNPTWTDSLVINRTFSNASITGERL